MSTTIQVQCPRCGRRLRTQAAHAGRTANCPNCEHEFVLTPTDEQPPSPRQQPPVQQGVAGVAQSRTHAPAANQSQSADHPQRQLTGADGRPATAAQPLNTQPQANWWLQTADGQQYGPVPRAEVDSWTAEGRIDASCWVYQDGWENWRSAAEVFPQVGGAAAAYQPAPQGRWSQPEPEANQFAQIAAIAQEEVVAPMQPQPAAGRETEVAITDRRIRGALRGTGPWAIVFAVAAFLGAGLSLVVFIYALAKLPSVLLKAMVTDLVANALFVVIYVLAGVLALVFSSRIRRFARTNTLQQLSTSLNANRAFWIVIAAGTSAMVVHGLLQLVAVIKLVSQVTPPS